MQFYYFLSRSTWKAFVSPRRKCPRFLLSLTGKLKGHKINAEVGHYFPRSLHGIQDTRAVMSVIIIAAFIYTLGFKKKKWKAQFCVIRYLYTVGFHTLDVGSCLCSPRPEWSQLWNERGGRWFQNSAPPGRSAGRCSTKTKLLNGSPLPAEDKRQQKKKQENVADYCS